MHFHVHVTIPTIDVWDFFFPMIIYFKNWGLVVSNWNFQNFVSWGICMQNTYCELCICNSNPMLFNFQQFSPILLEFLQMILCQTLIVSTILGKAIHYWKVITIKIIKNIKYLQHYLQNG